MKCLVVFGAENAHPLAWLLSRSRRHVLCALQDTEQNMWLSYNWHKGLPIIRAEAAADFDLEAHYLSHGFEVISIERGDIPCMSFSILNNCVGHVKVVCAIKSWALTPYQLYNSLTRKKGLTMKLKQLFTVPGFGGSNPSPPPPPPPLPPPPTKADPAVVQSREAEKRRLKQARGLRSTIKTNKTPMAAATTADKTLLGN
jgi:hypothetical protein|tara:strand:+ start:328 stop:927 length:600 start_codon:yes stop_codon:yes gene_type:complete